MLQRLLLLVVLCLIYGVNAYKKVEPYLERTVKVSAAATRQLAPELARLQFSVNAVGATAAEAYASNEEISAKVLTSVRETVPTAILQTSSITLSPNYVYNASGSFVDGYIARSQTTAEIPPQSVGIVLSTVTAIGVNEINSISYGLYPATQRHIELDLFEEASRIATQKAQAIVNGLDGVVLGKAITAAQAYAYVQPLPAVAESYALKSGGDARASAVSAGQVQVDVALDVTFEML